MIDSKNVIGILAVALLLLAGNAAEADLYKWVDDDGIVHFSDEPPSADRAQDIESMPSSPPSPEKPSPAPARADTSAPAQAPAAEQAPAKKPVQHPKVELYVTTWCKYCRMASNYLRSKRVPFVEYNIEKDGAAAKRREALDKRPGVPLAVINGTIILGFSEAAYDHALNNP